MGDVLKTSLIIMSCKSDYAPK